MALSLPASPTVGDTLTDALTGRVWKAEVVSGTPVWRLVSPSRLRVFAVGDTYMPGDFVLYDGASAASTKLYQCIASGPITPAAWDDAEWSEMIGGAAAGGGTGGGTQPAAGGLRYAFGNPEKTRWWLIVGELMMQWGLHTITADGETPGPTIEAFDGHPNGVIVSNAEKPEYRIGAHVDLSAGTLVMERAAGADPNATVEVTWFTIGKAPATDPPPSPAPPALD